MFPRCLVLFTAPYPRWVLNPGAWPVEPAPEPALEASDGLPPVPSSMPPWPPGTTLADLAPGSPCSSRGDNPWLHCTEGDARTGTAMLFLRNLKHLSLWSLPLSHVMAVGLPCDATQCSRVTRERAFGCPSRCESPWPFHFLFLKILFVLILFS